MRYVAYMLVSGLLGAACEGDGVRPADPEVIAFDAVPAPTAYGKLPGTRFDAGENVACEASALQGEVDPSAVCATASPAGKAHPGMKVAVPGEYTPTIELLFAHHPEDLPSRDVLAHHPEAEEALQWAVKQHHLTGIRARATILLGYFDTPSSTALVLERAQTESNGLLCAAAFEAISLWPLSKRERHSDLVETGLGDPRASVASAAQRAAAGLSGLNDETE